MAELSLERHHAVSHSELTSGHDVTQLLSQINQNFKQSKADQILRLLRDQDKLSDNNTESFVDDAELLKEYDEIKEERVICDSDTLTDSSSDSGDTLNTVNIPDTEIASSRHNNNQNITNMQENRNDFNEGRESRGFRRHRARTSFGFHHDTNDGMEIENVTPKDFDTRDISIRPKSSYVRRNQFKKRDEPDRNAVQNDNQVVEPPPQRPSKSARPKSRLGRASVPKSERKIIMMEADDVTEPENVAPTKEELVRGGANNMMYDRFASTRQPKRESKRTKAFCDSNFVPQQQTGVDASANLMDTRDDVTEVQTIAPNSNVNNTRNSHMSSFTNNQIPRNSPVQTHVQHVQKRPSNTHTRHEQNYNGHHQSTSVPVESHLMRTDTLTSNDGTMRSERTENISPTSQIPLKRNNSNLTYGRPKNPEPVTSRPIERPDIRPSTRTRRLHRRYMAPTQSHMAQVRPTSESVILARQKTEKNLMKKQAENRPHSEKIIINSQNKNIDLNLHPAQGPQTYVTSKGGVTQASHVQEGGFRGYDPSSRLRSSGQARDLPSDLTLPRRGQNNVVMGGRQPLAALMKLPPLEASLAAKKKERGLTLAARETCV